MAGLVLAVVELRGLRRVRAQARLGSMAWLRAQSGLVVVVHLLVRTG